ncbi:MAG: FtsQ-type POTRA domain-containing protein [Actinobacteria bacterium]|nr:FtsQ-type POTRA domain-containing protein [Actinomycetota bacterium]
MSPRAKTAHRGLRRPLPRWARRAAPVAVILAVVGGGTAFMRSSFFGADEVRVIGASHLSDARVIRDAGVQGENVLSLNTGVVEARLERDPWIANAVVTRSLPGTVTIRVTERTPVAAVQVAGGFELVAADGVTLGGTQRPGRLPVIPTNTVPGGATGGFLAPARVVGALAPDVRSEVMLAYEGITGEVFLRLRSGTVVRFGPLTSVTEKADALAAVLGWAGDQGARVLTIDLRFPRAPSARLSDGSTVTP